MVDNPLTLRGDYQSLYRRVNEYCSSQAASWRRIPQLALEANGRPRWHESYARAYVDGLWTLWVNPAVYLDCATGTLLDSVSADFQLFFIAEDISNRLRARGMQAGDKLDEKISAEYPEFHGAGSGVIDLALEPALIDTRLVIAQLEKEARAPYASGVNATEQDAVRERLRREHDVQPVYARGKKVFNYCPDKRVGAINY